MEKLPARFDDLITQHDRPVLVDFWAEWCGPCHMLAPVVKELARQWKGRVTVVKINTDEKPDLSQRYRISSIPTLILFKNGREIHRMSGAAPLERIRAEFEPYL
jgi:thioredoxin